VIVEMEKYILSDTILFEAKPDAVPYNYRISYKIAQLCLVIAYCCKRCGCSLLKLHMISIGMNTRQDRYELTEFANGRLSSNYTIVRFDPAVNRCIKYAIADGLIKQQLNGLFRLNKKGKKLVEKIKRIDDLMISEKSFLLDLSDKLDEDKIKSLMETWRYSSAEN